MKTREVHIKSKRKSDSASHAGVWSVEENPSKRTPRLIPLKVVRITGLAHFRNRGSTRAKDSCFQKGSSRIQLNTAE